MVDYKKKYLKYKKKYLAIKKLKGGMDWRNLPRLWEESVNTIFKKTEYVTGFEEKKKGFEEIIKTKQEKDENEIKIQNEKMKEKNRKHMLLIEENEKIFKLYETSDGPTQFPERMSSCEGHEKGHSLAAAATSLVEWHYKLDRFIVVVNKNVKIILPDTYAETLKYPEEIGKNSTINIYSDHDAISMPIHIPNDCEQNYPEIKLITFNLEGLCWGNSGSIEEEWSSEYNQYRLDNVISLLEPYVQKGNGNIFLFQEVVLKKAVEAKLEEENKKSLTNLKLGLNIEDKEYTLIHDNLTGAILYDNSIWQIDEIIEISRHYVDADGKINEENKKSNAYKLLHKHSIEIIIVVNIHLKAGLLNSDDEKRKSELAYIYNTVKNISDNFNIPVYFGGDWNSEKIDNSTLVELEKIINDPNPDIDFGIVNHLIPPQAEAVQVEEPAEESPGTVQHGILSLVEEDWLKV